MSNIKILPEQVFNKIAAGEVIARPASVVKELVENAIDAGASKVIVKIENAGSKLISVTDNGNGMDADDALLCLEPHATSKIASENDINQILTFGFRGEAIPSIASISRFSIKTRQEESLEGTEVIIEGGKLIRSVPTGCAPGTEMAVKDLFYNTPARKKFLKALATEEKHIFDTVVSLALPYPSVAFELIFDGRSVLSSPAYDNLLPRLQSFFGKSFQEALLPIKFQEADMTVSGFAARHGFTRNSRKEQRVYVNGRPVDAIAAYHGIRDGYGSLVPKGKYPPVILFLQMDPLLVDVNVHPAKKEVRFRQERLVSRVICSAIRTQIKSAAMPTVNMDSDLTLNSILHGAEIDYALKQEHPELDLATASTSFDRGHAQPSASSFPRPSFPRPVLRPQPLFSESVETEPFENPEEIVEDNSRDEAINTENQNSDYQNHFISSEQTKNQDISEVRNMEQRSRASSFPPDHCEIPGSGPLDILGFLDNAYIIARAETGLIIVDQHAAHERVLFEQLLRNTEQDHPSQRLLIPITIELTRSEIVFLEKHRKLFSGLGFELEPFGQNTVLIHEIPNVLPQDNIGTFISDLLEDLSENQSVSRKFDLSLIAMAACKKAVKAHDELTLGEARSLLQQMANCELPFSCPHGRPTIINISFKELEKRFGRK